ncbi:hypothetical protein [Legionella longbeachae]|uniref:hypothetical protein n=1 Tax=Legionella longbeachae TaxID=450 RepID=UPI000F745D8B|nr:hypothetical protein [Legionella longbeachae]QIN31748.1 hypothetical protein GCB94_06120 [Legionella longbeachae]
MRRFSEEISTSLWQCIIDDASDELRVSKPISGVTYKVPSDRLCPQVVSCSSYISNKFTELQRCISINMTAIN